MLSKPKNLRFAFCLLYSILVATIKTVASDSIPTILFIGNSLTYSNNLPQMVQEIGKRDSVMIQFKTVCLPNYSLEDHWNEGRVQIEIEKGAYDYVVVQQGPSAAPESQRLLLAYAGKLAALCKKHGAQLCLFAVWPSQERLFDLDGVIASYRKAATETKSLLAPAGLAWKLAWQKTPGFALYSTDRFHPSPIGSFLAAMVIYGTIRNKTHFDFLTPPFHPLREMTNEQLQHLKDAAKAALTFQF